MLRHKKRQHSQGEERELTAGSPKLSDNVHILAANLNRLMEHHRKAGTGLGSNAGLGAAAKVSSNTVARLRRGDGSITILKLTKICRVLKVQVWELLHPGFDPEARLEVVFDAAERNLLEAFRRKTPPTQH